MTSLTPGGWTSGPTRFDLAIVGSGSGNSIAEKRFKGRRTAILEKGVLGGTCLNVGRNFRAERLANVTLYEGHARFTGPRTIDTATGETITADQVVIAAGSRPTVPDVAGLADVEHHTSDTIMRIDELPGHLPILGYGFVAAEFAHVLGSFGSRVTILDRSGALLRGEDDEVSAAFTSLAQERWDVPLDTEVTRAERYDGRTRLHLRGPDGDGTLGDVSNRYQLEHVSNHDSARLLNEPRPAQQPPAERRVRHLRAPRRDRPVGRPAPEDSTAVANRTMRGSGLRLGEHTACTIRPRGPERPGTRRTSET